MLWCGVGWVRKARGLGWVLGKVFVFEEGSPSFPPFSFSLILWIWSFLFCGVYDPLTTFLFGMFIQLRFLFSCFRRSIFPSICHSVYADSSFLLPFFQINEYLPAHIRMVQKSGHPVAWICDPMHGKWVSSFFFLSFFLPFFSSFCSCPSSVFSFFLLGSCIFPINL